MNSLFFYINRISVNFEILCFPKHAKINGNVDVGPLVVLSPSALVLMSSGNYRQPRVFVAVCWGTFEQIYCSEFIR